MTEIIWNRMIQRFEIKDASVNDEARITYRRNVAYVSYRAAVGKATTFIYERAMRAQYARVSRVVLCRGGLSRSWLEWKYPRTAWFAFMSVKGKIWMKSYQVVEWQTQCGVQYIASRACAVNSQCSLYSTPPPAQRHQIIVRTGNIVTPRVHKPPNSPRTRVCTRKYLVQKN